ncbi:MAG TPA: glycosyltransferase family 4 protein, partial [Myxococcota bacterium]|nr:glycosyltransferase family 4 protein [Myxococcota bacterium]
NEEFWGKWFVGDGAAFRPAEGWLRLFEPLNFYELCASRLGFLPEPFAFSVRGFAALAARLRAGDRFDLIHDVQTLGWGHLATARLGIPMVTTIHHPLSEDRRHSFQRDETLSEAIGTVQFHPVGMQAFVARRMARVITSSEVSARTIARDFGVESRRIRNLYNGLDTDLFRPDPSAVRDPNEILCVGRAGDPTKGVDALVDALALLPPPAKVTLVDQDHPDHRARRRAAANGCADRLHVTGRVSEAELVRLYRRAAVVAVPSNFEGFGLPAAEAMACGTPVVASTAGALPEVVRAGGGGVLVPPRDPEALAKGIRSLLEQPEARRELAERAREGVVAHFSWPAVARRTVEVYEEALAEHRARGH